MKNQDITKRGIIYCRVSDPTQVQGTSLERQKEECLRYAQREDITIPESAIFIEKGESATAANRTELIKALEYCREQNGRVQSFIVWKIDRFARNQTDHFALKAQLKKYGVRLHSVTEPIQNDPMGNAFEGMLSMYAQFENEIRKQRCEGGMRRKVEEGIWPWQPPIGYVHSKKLTDRRKTRPDEPDEERFYLIQKALKTYATGKYAAVQVCDMAAKWGLTSRQGFPMRKQLFEKILRDPFYAGMLVNPWTKEMHKGLHVPMISWEEFEIIQNIKRGFARPSERTARSVYNPDFPLRRFVMCVCGRRLTGSWHQGRNKKYCFYHCQNKECERRDRGIRKDEMESRFVELLQQVKPREDYIAAFEEMVLEVWKARKVSAKDDQVRYDHEIKKLEIQKEQLLQMRMRGEITQVEFTNHKTSIEDKITDLYRAKDETGAAELESENVVTYGTAFIRNIVEQWQTLSVKPRHRLQKLVYPQGLTYDKTASSYGTAVLSPVLTLIGTFTGDQSYFVALVGRDWHHVMQWLCDSRLSNFANRQERCDQMHGSSNNS